MRITAAARRLGCSADWIKNLEARGVVAPLPRDVHGHRRLSEEDLERLRQVLFPRGEKKGLAPKFLVPNGEQKTQIG